MHRNIAYCWLVVSTFGIVSISHSLADYNRPAISHSHDEVKVRPGPTAQQKLYEISEDDNANANESDDDSGPDRLFKINNNVKKLVKTAERFHSNDRMMTSFAAGSKKPTSRRNSVKFQFGRSGPSNSYSGVPASGTGSRDSPPEYYDETKRYEARRHFKFGKKSADESRFNDNNDPLTEVKRKMIKFGKKSVVV